MSPATAWETLRQNRWDCGSGTSPSLVPDPQTPWERMRMVLLYATTFWSGLLHSLRCQSTTCGPGAILCAEGQWFENRTALGFMRCTRQVETEKMRVIRLNSHQRGRMEWQRRMAEKNTNDPGWLGRFWHCGVKEMKVSYMQEKRCSFPTSLLLVGWEVRCRNTRGEEGRGKDRNFNASLGQV